MKLDVALSSVRAALALAVTCGGCAHDIVQDRSLVLVQKAIHDACIPFVAEGIGDDEVQRRLGGRWTRNLPDPFTPPAGPIFRARGLRLQIIDGRAQRNADGSPTSRPVRTCNIWMGPHDAGDLMSMARAAAASSPEAIFPKSAGSDLARQIVACLPMADGHAVVRVSSYSQRSTGAGVYQTYASAVPSACR